MRLRAYSGRSLPPNVRALGLVSFLQDVASEMVYPLLPGFLALLGGGALALGTMESAAEGMLALVKGWAGRASDRVGKRKPFVLWGYAISAAARPLLALAAAPWHVVALRTGDRFSKGLRTAPRDAMIADSTPEDQRGFAFSYHNGLDHLGAAVGPLVAAAVLALAPGRMRLVFALATVPALAGVAVVWWRVRESGFVGRVEEARRGAPPAPHVVASAANVEERRVGLPPALKVPLIAVFLFGLGNASDAFLLLRASQLGMSAIGLTLLWSAFHVVKWACSAPSGRLVDRLGPGRPLVAGWGLYAAVYAGFAYTSSIAALLALLAVYALYYGLTEGAERTLVTELAGDAGRGTVLGAYHLASGAGLFLASLLFGLVWERASARAAFLLGGALALLATVLLAAVLARRGARR
ncbi:MAG TPA: MFS transporter [Thermoanaerobaculia bacterium]|jgi:MFS family permease|nr:MFS transporter [Thermoanaerobaculia bacterium]